MEKQIFEQQTVISPKGCATNQRIAGNGLLENLIEGSR